MIENDRIVLSFVDKSIKVRHFDRRSVATILSGFKFSQIEKKFEDMGFETLPEFIGELLYTWGYRKDYNLNMWVIKTTGESKCSPDDDYNETTGYRIAIMRAKEKAYDNALNALSSIGEIFRMGVDLLDNTNTNLAQYSWDEYEAIERVIETGKSDMID